MRRKDDGSIRVGKKVVAIRAIGDIPEGATGRVKVVDGLTWFRYWVKWDTGEWSAWVGDDEIVRVDRLEVWRAQQAQAAEKAALALTGATSPPAGGDGGGSEAGASAELEGAAAASGVPAHLLARSAAARAKRPAS